MHKTVITHADADGILCVVLLLKKFGNLQRIFFTSPARLKRTLTSSILKADRLDELYVVDFSADKELLLLSSFYKKALWIDHHEWPELQLPSNVEVFVDKSSPSSTQLVAKKFGVESELVELANQIDRNEVQSEDAIFLRDLVAAIRWKYSNAELQAKLESFAKLLYLHGLQRFKQSEEVEELLQAYFRWVERMKEQILEKVKVCEFDSKRVAIFETDARVPIFIVCEKLEQHSKAPFDVIAVLTHKKDRTKIEFRTQTSLDVHAIASKLGGGGHRQAAGVTVEEVVSAERLLELLKASL